MSGIAFKTFYLSDGVRKGCKNVSKATRASGNLVGVPGLICQKRQLIPENSGRLGLPLAHRGRQLTSQDGLGKPCRNECFCLILIGSPRTTPLTRGN